MAALNATTPVMSSCFLNPWIMFPELGFLVSGCTLHQFNNVHWTLSHIIHVSQAWNLWPCLCKQLMMQTHFTTFQLTFSANPTGWDQIKPSWTQGKVRAQLIFPAELFQATEWRAQDSGWFMDKVTALLKFFQVQMHSTWSGWGHRIPAETHVGQTSLRWRHIAISSQERFLRTSFLMLFPWRTMSSTFAPNNWYLVSPM